MSGIIWIIVIGFVAGIIARFLSPGPNNPTGFILTRCSASPAHSCHLHRPDRRLVQATKAPACRRHRRCVSCCSSGTGSWPIACFATLACQGLVRSARGSRCLQAHRRPM